MEIDVSGLVSTHKNIKGSVGHQYIYPAREEIIFFAIINIYGARVIFKTFMLTRTPNLSNEKDKLI